MGTVRANLSRSEKDRYLDVLQKLQAEGHAIEIPEEVSQTADVLQIEVDAYWRNEVLDVGIMGGVGYYVVRFRMIAERPEVTLLEYEITTDWDDQIDLLDVDLREQRELLRQFGLAPREVLNSRFASPLRFRSRGQVIEGSLVAAGSRLIPPEYRNGAIVWCQLNFWDQFGHKIGARADLSVRRLKQRSAAMQPSTGLLEPVENQVVRPLSVSQDSRVQLRGSVCREEMASPEGRKLSLNEKVRPSQVSHRGIELV